MQSLRNRRSLSWVLVLWGLCLLVPPGAWALCVGGDGHVAFEIGDGPCAGEATPSPGDSPSCCASECGPCVDIPVLRGIAMRTERPSLDELPAIPSSSFAPSADPAPPHGSLPERSTGLAIPMTGRAAFFLRI